MAASRSLIRLCLHSSKVAARPALRQASTMLPRTAPCQIARPFTSSPVLFKKGKAGKSKKEDELDDGAELPEFSIEPFQEDMDRAINWLSKEAAKLRQGRQNPALLDNLKIELSEGALQLKDVAMASLKDGKTMLVSVFEEEHVKPVQTAIQQSPHGLNPQPASGNPLGLIIPLPQPTREARNKIAAEISKIGESSKTVLKRARQDALKLLKSAQLPKDANKKKEAEVEKVMKKGSDEVTKIVEATKKAVLQ
ncbi:hypothetical protein YB2330_004650 [Saitoella coloradoensis]